MGKILLLIIIAAVAIAWYRARLRAEERGDGREDGSAPKGPRAPERMVSCAQCKVHLPASEAVFDAAGTAFCGAPHLEAHRARAGR